jgi:hypothetical protein
MWHVGQTQAGLPAYPDLQIVLFPAGAVVVIVAATVALGGLGYRIARRRFPASRFVLVTMAIGLAGLIIFVWQISGHLWINDGSLGRSPGWWLGLLVLVGPHLLAAVFAVAVIRQVGSRSDDSHRNR